MKQLGISRRAVLAFGSAAAFGLQTARGQPEEADASASANGAALDEVWETVRDRFYDPHLHGLDWPAIRARYRPQATAAGSKAELAAAINAMLAELHASHTEYFTPDQTAYYELADIFAGSLRRRGLQRHFNSGEVSYSGIGVFTKTDDQGRIFLSGVIEGAPAHQAGLLRGDEILEADGMEFGPVASFRGKIGVPVSLSVRRLPGESPFSVSVTPAELHPNATFLHGLEQSARVISAGPMRIGYVHVWCYAGWSYQQALETLIAEGPLRQTDALIWDLRDGWGGAEPQYLDLFNPRAATMQLRDRNGETHFDDVKWRKPAAMLVNGGTRSGKEVLAYGFKKYRIGEVIGTQTARAVLASSAFMMGNGDLLLLAVSDVLVDGEHLEGVGVAPTLEVPFDLRYSAGKDPQLDRAVQVLTRI
jgi:carboxyl-terminal processing protease